MGTLNQIYLFDVNGYKKVITPILSQLNSGVVEPLRIAAHRSAKENPQIWPLLEKYRIYQDDLGNEEQEYDTLEGRVKFWMLLILSSYWQPVVTPRGYPNLVRQLLDKSTVNRDLIDQLVRGKSICALLHPEIVTDSDNDKSWSSICPYWWCHLGMIGWLDYQDVNRLLKTVRSLQDHFLQPTIGENGNTFQTIVRVLSEASQNKKGLLISITD